MLTPNHSTSIEVPHDTTIKVLQQGTSIKVPNGTSMDVLHTWLKIAEGVCSNFLISIIYAIESSIMYIQNFLNIFTFRYCPEFVFPMLFILVYHV